MLKVFLDKGQKAADDGDEIMTVVATVFKPVRYTQFVRHWNRMLEGWGASAFHATDFYSGYQEFRRDTKDKRLLFEQDCRRLPSLVANSVEKVVVTAFRPKEFAEKASQWWRREFNTNPHGIAAQLSAITIGFWAKKRYPSQQFAYFQESGDPGQGGIEESIAALRKNFGSVVRISSFTSMGKGCAPGLEASDFAAWHYDKHYIDRVKRNLPPRKDFKAFIDLLESKRKLQFAFIIEARLELFFQTVEGWYRDKPQDNAKQERAPC